MSRSPAGVDIVLIGAGHAHVEVLRRFALRPEPGVQLTLIAREPRTPYTGMLPGLIRGDYTFEEAHIDLAPLAAASGAGLVIDAATGIDLAARQVTFARHAPIPFDLLSIDVGGEPRTGEGGLPVRPIGRFLDHLAELERTLAPADRIAVVGGGPGGTELALALAARFGGQARVALVCADAEPVASAPAFARAVVRDALAHAGIEVARGVRAGALRDGRVALSDGGTLEAAAALWATGVAGPAWLAATGLACDADGCVVVDAALRSVSHLFVFAAGDCAAMQRAARPKAGVWAVRAGAPLAANLRRAARDLPPTRWRPQRGALVILGLGRGRAVAWRFGLSVSGTLVWRWKDRIDRRWMARFKGFQAGRTV